jgi:hypothetical protein
MDSATEEGRRQAKMAGRQGVSAGASRNPKKYGALSPNVSRISDLSRPDRFVGFRLFAVGFEFSGAMTLEMSLAANTSGVPIAGNSHAQSPWAVPLRTTACTRSSSVANDR